jgi:hypothetical protein
MLNARLTDGGGNPAHQVKQAIPGRFFHHGSFGHMAEVYLRSCPSPRPHKLFSSGHWLERSVTGQWGFMTSKYCLENSIRKTPYSEGPLLCPLLTSKNRCWKSSLGITGYRKGRQQ